MKCEDCTGTGSEYAGGRCLVCNGTGQVPDKPDSGQFPIACPLCGGYVIGLSTGEGLCSNCGAGVKQPYMGLKLLEGDRHGSDG